MEELTKEMRQVMTAWVADPDNSDLKRRYKDLQARYQRLFMGYKKGQRRNGVA